MPRSTPDLTPDLTEDSPGRDDNSPTDAALVEKAENLDTLRDAVVEAAGVSMGLWLSYLFVLFYFAIAAGGVTHRDLFFENPIRLPFLSVDLPLVGFFVLAPGLVLIVHAYVLLHVVLLSGKIDVFNAGLRATEIKDPALPVDALRRQLPSNIFVQYLAGPSDVRSGVMGYMLRQVAQISLVVCPVGLLVLFQLQFLPFHRWDVTWLQRFSIVLDIVLLWVLWPSITGSPRRVAVAATASIATLLVAFTLATYPGEWLDRMPSVRFVPTKWPQSNSQAASTQTGPARCATGVAGDEDDEDAADATKVENAGQFQRFAAWLKSMGWSSLYTVIIAGDVNPTTRRPTSWWPNSNRLVLPGFDITDQPKFDSDQKIENVPYTASLRGRHLESAVLCGANLRKVDFTGATLGGAFLNRARLQGALLDGANLQDARFHFAALQGASITGAELQRAHFGDAQLQGADLTGAALQFAQFKNADLTGANLVKANLQDVSFELAHLQAVAFDYADLSRASLRFANLQGASLTSANLQRANLIGTLVWGVDVREEANANLDNAVLLPCWDSKDGPFCKDSDFSKSSYTQLESLIKTQVPAGDLQRLALDRIQPFDPANPLEEQAEMAKAWAELAKRPLPSSPSR